MELNENILEVDDILYLITYQVCISTDAKMIRTLNMVNLRWRRLFAKYKSLWKLAAVRLLNEYTSNTVSHMDYLLYSARVGSADAVYCLFRAGLKPHPDLNGKTPLILAAEHDHYMTCKTLICLGMAKDINAQDESGRTAINYAIANGSSKICLLLVAAGAHRDSYEAAPENIDGISRMLKKRKYSPFILLALSILISGLYYKAIPFLFMVNFIFNYEYTR